MWPSNCAKLHHMLGSLLVFTCIECKDCQMFSIRFLQIPNWLYPNMITFLWYNERMQIMMEMKKIKLNKANLIIFRKANVALEKRMLGMNEMNFVFPHLVSPME